MNIVDLFPWGTKELVLEKAMQMFAQDPDNPGIKPPSVYVLRAIQAKDENGNPLFYEKGRSKGNPVMQIEAIPFIENIIQLNTDLYNDLVKANETIIIQNKALEEAAAIKTAYFNLKEEYKKLL